MQHHLRLRRKEDFSRLRKKGRVWRHHLFVLSVVPNGLSHNRYGFVISKRVGTAVVRNRIRRWLREVLRRVDPHLVPGHDMVLIVRQAIVGQSYHTVHKAVIASLHDAGLWMPPSGAQSG